MDSTMLATDLRSPALEKPLFRLEVGQASKRQSATHYLGGLRRPDISWEYQWLAAV